MSRKAGASIQRGRLSSAPKGVTIFISYSQKDDQWATRIHEALENNNITGWRDKSRIRAGEKISDCVSSAINLANYVILLLSADSNSSGWVEKDAVDILNPDAVVLGGGIVEALMNFDLFRNALKIGFENNVLSITKDTPILEANLE